MPKRNTSEKKSRGRPKKSDSKPLKKPKMESPEREKSSESTLSQLKKVLPCFFFPAYLLNIPEPNNEQ